MNLILLAALTSAISPPSPQAANHEITLRVGKDLILIANGAEESQRFHDEGKNRGGLLLTCAELQLVRNSSTYQLRCKDIRFLTSGGIEGSAPLAEIDLMKNVALLSGTQKSPVQIIREGEDETDFTKMVAQRINLQLPPLRLTEDGSAPAALE